MTAFIYNYVFTFIGIILGIWGMIRFGSYWLKTKYYWKGIKFLVCLILSFSYVILFFDDLILVKPISSDYIVILFRPLVLVILLTLILDVPNNER